jgi:CubicO group peptidase (beta-lactamase class C family)
MRDRGVMVYARRVSLSGIAALALAGVSCVKDGPLREGMMTEADLAKALTRIAARRNVPALSAALVRYDGSTVSAAVGRTVVGGGQEVDALSRFNIGSTTKSMTAIVLGTLVAEGRLRWETTLEEALPGIRMRGEYKRATIHDLLLSRAGIIAFQRTDLEDPGIVGELWVEIPRAMPDPREQRRAVTELSLDLPPIARPGTKSVYSNVGWAIAGHIAEIAAGISFEDLMKNRIFDPLGMSGSTIGGWPARASDPLQPRGHYPPSWFLGRPRPQALDDVYTFPDWMNPTGGVNCTIDDYARYALECLRGLRGEGKVLDAEGYERILSVQGTARAEEMYMKTDAGGELQLGYGWGVVTTDSGTAFVGDGTGGTFYARIGLLPGKGIGFVALSNAGNAEPAITDAQKLLTGIE